MSDRGNHMISEDDLAGLFDIAVSSMDFGSGFLSTEEVELLRRTAVQLGLDPLKGTPDAQIGSYPHPYIPFTWEERDYRNWDRRTYPDNPPLISSQELCRHYHCKKPANDPVHTV